MLSNYFKKTIKIIVLIVFCLSGPVFAGSYEDFFRATQNDQVQVVSSLLARGFDPNTVNLNGEAALFDAWKNESYKSLDLLIQHPLIQLNVKNSHHETVLMLACLKGDLKRVKWLIQHKADINQVGWTPLHYAASGGQVGIVKLLLDESAYIDAESPNGTTPLMMAARYGNPEVVRLLIQEGADVQLKNQLGLSALDFANQTQQTESSKLLEFALSKVASTQTGKP